MVAAPLRLSLAMRAACGTERTSTPFEEGRDGNCLAEASRSRPCAPFDGEQVLVAVPNRVGDAWSVDGLTLDPDFPFNVFLARWDEGGRWATTETDDDTNGILWLTADQPMFWAKFTLPY